MSKVFRAKLDAADVQSAIDDDELLRRLHSPQEQRRDRPVHY